jgi:hypothetical protein
MPKLVGAVTLADDAGADGIPVAEDADAPCGAAGGRRMGQGRGVERIMFTGTCAAYSEICPTAGDPREFTARPVYYGLVFTHLLGTGKFLPVKVSTGATARNVVAYALKPASGGPRVMVENLTSLPTTITLAVGGNATSAKVLRLTAPGLLAKSGVRIQARRSAPRPA